MSCATVSNLPVSPLPHSPPCLLGRLGRGRGQGSLLRVAHTQSRALPLPPARGAPARPASLEPRVPSVLAQQLPERHGPAALVMHPVRERAAPLLALFRSRPHAVPCRGVRSQEAFEARRVDLRRARRILRVAGWPRALLVVRIFVVVCHDRAERGERSAERRATRAAAGRGRPRGAPLRSGFPLLRSPGFFPSHVLPHTPVGPSGARAGPPRPPRPRPSPFSDRRHRCRARRAPRPARPAGRRHGTGQRE